MCVWLAGWGEVPVYFSGLREPITSQDFREDTLHEKSRAHIFHQTPTTNEKAATRQQHSQFSQQPPHTLRTTPNNTEMPIPPTQNEISRPTEMTYTSYTE